MVARGPSAASGPRAPAERAEGRLCFWPVPADERAQRAGLAVFGCAPVTSCGWFEAVCSMVSSIPAIQTCVMAPGMGHAYAMPHLLLGQHALEDHSTDAVAEAVAAVRLGGPDEQAAAAEDESVEFSL